MCYTAAIPRLRRIDPHMNNEEFERKAEFIINQQARFDVNIQKLQEGQARLQENQKRFDESHRELQEAQKRTDHALAELVELTTDGFKIVVDHLRNLSFKIDALVNSQVRTDEELRKTDEVARRTSEEV